MNAVKTYFIYPFSIWMILVSIVNKVIDRKNCKVRIKGKV